MPCVVIEDGFGDQHAARLDEPADESAAALVGIAAHAAIELAESLGLNEEEDRIIKFGVANTDDSGAARLKRDRLNGLVWLGSIDLGELVSTSGGLRFSFEPPPSPEESNDDLKDEEDVP